MANQCLLSLALIMRDAAEEILACLESCAASVDEMVIADTGSRDASVKTVRKFLRRWQAAVPGRRGKLYEIQWQDDFATARNYVLSRCRGAWVIFLDSDERLSADTRGNLRQVIESLALGRLPAGVQRVRIPGRGLPEGGQIDLLELWRENVDLSCRPLPGTPDDLAVRILRRQEGLRYQGEVHEQLLFADGRELKVALADKQLLSVLHTGYRPEVGGEKTARNWRILRKEERQGGSTCLLDYYLADMYLEQGKWQQAISRAEKALGGNLPVHDSIAPHRIICQALRELEKEACREAGLEIAEGEPLPPASPEEPAPLQRLRSLRRRIDHELASVIAAWSYYPDFYYFRGGRRWNGGDKAGGKADLEHALALAEAFPRAHPELDFRFRELMPSLMAALEQVRREWEEQQQNNRKGLTKNEE